MSEYPLTTADLPTEKCLGTVRNRPWIVQSFFVIGAGALIIFANNWGGRLIGIFLLALCGLSIMVTKDFITCKLYKKTLAIYDPRDQNRINLVAMADILSYELDSKALSFVLLTIKQENPTGSGEKNLVISTFQAAKLNRKLHKIIPDKDKAAQRLEAFQKNRLSKKEIAARKQAAQEAEEQKTAD